MSVRRIRAVLASSLVGFVLVPGYVDEAPPPPTTPEVLALFTFQDGSGTTITNHVGTDATVHTAGAGWIDGPADGAYDVNGAARLGAVHSSAFDIASGEDLTIDVMFRWDGNATGGDQNYLVVLEQNYEIAIKDNGDLWYAVRDNWLGNYPGINLDSLGLKGKWVSLTMQYEGTAERATFFVNGGFPVVHETAGNYTGNPRGDTLQLGYRSNSGTKIMNGALAYARVAKGILNDGISLGTSSLKAVYSFDEGAGTVVNDRAGHSDATITGGAGWIGGPAGGGYDLDSTATITASHVNKLDIKENRNFTVEAIFRWDGDASGGADLAYLVSKENDFSVLVHDDGRILYAVRDHWATQWTTVDLDALGLDGKWVGMTFEYDASAGKARIWINGGNPTLHTPTGTASTAALGDTLAIGWRTITDPDKRFNGAISFLRVRRGKVNLSLAPPIQWKEQTLFASVSGGGMLKGHTASGSATSVALDDTLYIGWRNQSGGRWLNGAIAYLKVAKGVINPTVLAEYDFREGDGTTISDNAETADAVVVTAGDGWVNGPKSYGYHVGGAGEIRAVDATGFDIGSGQDLSIDVIFRWDGDATGAAQGYLVVHEKDYELSVEDDGDLWYAVRDHWTTNYPGINLAELGLKGRWVSLKFRYVASSNRATVFVEEVTPGPRHDAGGRGRRRVRSSPDHAPVADHADHGPCLDTDVDLQRRDRPSLPVVSGAFERPGRLPDSGQCAGHAVGRWYRSEHRNLDGRGPNGGWGQSPHHWLRRRERRSFLGIA